MAGDLMMLEVAAAHAQYMSSASSAIILKQEEEEETRKGLRFLLPPPPLHHRTAPLAAAASSKNLAVPLASTRVKSNYIAASSTSPISSDADATPARKWTFQVIASLRAKPCSLASDVIAAIDFDETGSRFATGGIARKIRICSYSTLVSDNENLEFAGGKEAIDEDDFEEERQLLGPHGTGKSLRSSKRKNRETQGLMIQNHDQASLRIICTPAKLSSLKWRPLGSNVIGCGDYDGVVTEWDVEQGLCLSERYEHSGQRIWSVDYSSWFPTLCASASGDGTVRLWTLNCERSVGVIRSPGKNSICCAEFSSNGPHRVAVACADSNVYIYDVRRLDSSLLCLRGHERAASYVRFLGGEEVVSASIDSTIKLWDVSNVAALPSSRVKRAVSCFSDGLACEHERKKCSFRGSRGDDPWRVRKTFNLHRNVKNFVGLSVWKEGGLIACGSESDEVFVYERRSNVEPVWRMKFPSCSYARARALRRLATTDLHKAAHVNILDQEEEEEEEEKNCTFVGAVCWRDQGDHLSLLTANSQGTVQLVKVCSNRPSGHTI